MLHVHAIDNTMNYNTCSDLCQYSHIALTEWMPKWRMNGWKTTNGEDVKNKTDLERLSDACSKIDVKWVKCYISVPS